MIYQHVPVNLLAGLEKIEQEFIEQFSACGVIENALLLGDPRQSELLDHCQAQHRYLMCEEYPKLRTKTAQLCLGRFIDLPYAKESMDFIILPHVLEFSTEPKVVLKEAADCLSRRGTLLIFSLSPFSRFAPFSPLSAYATKQLLSEAGLDVIATQSFFSILSTISKNKIMHFLDKIVTPYLPFLCNAYLIVAQKTTVTPTTKPLKSYTTRPFTLALNSACAARSGNS